MRQATAVKPVAQPTVKYVCIPAFGLYPPKIELIVGCCRPVASAVAVKPAAAPAATVLKPTASSTGGAASKGMRLGAKKVEAKFDDWGDDWDKDQEDEEKEEAYWILFSWCGAGFSHSCFPFL